MPAHAGAEPDAGAAEGVEFIRRHVIRGTEKAFDDFVGGSSACSARRRRALTATHSAAAPGRRIRLDFRRHLSDTGTQ
ncbi:hypothetical protein D5041_10325 [Verminephrobacter aporrectodeae subsp. tuberculatae]|uniref:Uncharacterized protein n=2 Tax=Verminephrobacter TaxID=364316 RepID=A0ABT3KRE5_9BURK|nr:hypothetical protein [Verminephrobacter aporrectodeae subsp. tuberculatae]MCW5255884.1 hypothetical protein [Verminephrobacter aporrectodeae subsp. tuberculatae]MCW5289440.1 hypothetical protein [Verminephrobacter aporrectodeae subsp. tuberculatae]MCW5320898.1 hypothetical protein [Verminephrobacter aporrectodeae subsp. tuberculatae]MCW8208405.1 hypothetical protein [Verminephrobacter aporrectodeae subsp. tuberculatae]